MKLLVIDGNSIINRAFYGIRLLSTADGTFTNGIYGFLTILAKETEAEKPDGIVAAFDMRAPTFRHIKYDKYKAQRKGMPDELAVQLPILKEVLDAMGIMCLEKEGYEADDIIGTISEMCEKSGDSCVIITGDKDDLQLVSPHTTCKLAVTKGGKNESTAFTPEVFFEKYGFTPEKMVDLKALWGDTSDNIPGVAGIGEKTAADLVARFGTVEDIYKNIDTLDIKPAVKAKLEQGRDSAFLSYELATIFRQVPLDKSLEDMKLRKADYKRLFGLYQKLEFRQFAEKIKDRALQADAAETVMPEKAETVPDVDGLRAVLADADKIYIVKAGDGVYFSKNGALYVLNPIETSGFYDAANLLIMWGCKKCAHDIKGLLTDFAGRELTKAEAGTFTFDTMLAAYLINPAASSYSAASLAGEYLGANVSACGAASLMPEIEAKLAQRLDALSMNSLFYEIELPLAFTLYDMERKGIKLDTAHLTQYGRSLKEHLAEYTERIYTLAGEQFNINSPKQLGVILFEKLNLPGGKKSGKTGAYKTDADTLNSLKGYEIVDYILKFRQYSKLISTYVEGLLKVVSPDDSRVHTTFNQAVTVTGRISSAEPNLQNIPVRTELGRDMRKMFVADEGNILIDADYSQIELRVLAALSGDVNMKNAFLSGSDIHAVTASQVFGVPLSMVTDDMRRKAKAVNFGIVYGISAFSLADDIGSSVKDAKDYIAAYFATYSGVKAFLDEVVAAAKKDGFVTTAFGRRRMLPELKSSNFNLRSFGERAAMNTPIQGTAADIIKLAMVRVQSRLKEEGLTARLVLQIHDELIIEAPVSEKDAASAILRQEMENAYKMAVPLVADVGCGYSWYEAK